MNATDIPAEQWWAEEIVEALTASAKGYDKTTVCIEILDAYGCLIKLEDSAMLRRAIGSGTRYLTEEEIAFFLLVLDVSSGLIAHAIGHWNAKQVSRGRTALPSWQLHDAHSFILRAAWMYPDVLASRLAQLQTRGRTPKRVKFGGVG